MGKSVRAKAGLAIAGLAMGLSGCVSTLEEDIPFVARLNTAQANEDIAQGDEAPKSGGFSLFQNSGDNASGQGDAVNPFAGLFKPKAPREEGSDSGEQTAANPFKGLFSKNTEGEDAAAEVASRNGGTGLFGSSGSGGQSQAEINAAKRDAQSVIITGLQSRRSILPGGSAYDTVASAVLAANARAAEAELRAARLRAVAASKNWLPSVGPSISLSSLGELVANLIVEQVLFDNGRKKAERAYAAADVEVAAVSLSDDTNTRVFTALDLYLKSQEGADKSELATKAFNDMSHFEYIMDQRVQGGVSNRSDLVVLRQKLAEIRSEMSIGREAQTTALAELNAMSVRDLSGVSGVPGLQVNGLSATPLAILMAEAEKERAVAEATMARASSLPGLKAVGSVGDSGNKLGLQVASDQLFGLGTGATLKAIEATKEGAQRQVAQAREDSNRRLRALEANLSSVKRQLGEANGLASQSKKNLDLFQAQYKAGTRQVMDVVGVYETYARQQQRAVELKYASSRLELEIAREMGLLADGGSI